MPVSLSGELLPASALIAGPDGEARGRRSPASASLPAPWAADAWLSFVVPGATAGAQLVSSRTTATTFFDEERRPCR